MDMTTISYLVALIGCAVGVSGFALNRDKSKQNDAEWRGQIAAKLDNIMCSVSGIKNDVERIEERLNKHGERIATLESSVKQAHHRIDSFNGDLK